MDINQQKKWREELNQARQKSLQRTLPFGTQKKQITERMEYYKQQLKQAVAEKNQTATETNLTNLMRLRAKQYQLWHDETKERMGICLPEDMASALQKYYTDCAQLSLAAEF